MDNIWWPPQVILSTQPAGNIWEGGDIRHVDNRIMSGSMNVTIVGAKKSKMKASTPKLIILELEPRLGLTPMYAMGISFCCVTPMYAKGISLSCNAAVVCNQHIAIPKRQYCHAK